MTEAKDGAGVTDGYAAELKGPDPNEWGEDSDRPEAIAGTPGGTPGLAIGEIRNEGSDEELKGPGPQWETGEEGEFVNR